MNLDVIKELIAAYLPAISSISAIIISVFAFLGKVKTIVGNNIKESKLLKDTMNTVLETNETYKNQLSEYNKNTAEVIQALNDEVKALKDSIKASKAEAKAAKEETEAIKAQLKEYENVEDELRTVRAQLTEVLEEE